MNAPWRIGKIQFHNSKRLENPLAEKIPSRRLHGEALLLLVEFPFFFAGFTSQQHPKTVFQGAVQIHSFWKTTSNIIKYVHVFFSFRGKFRFYFLDLQQLCHLAAFLPTSELNRTIDSSKNLRARWTKPGARRIPSGRWGSWYRWTLVAKKRRCSAHGSLKMALGCWIRMGMYIWYIYIYIYLCEYIYIYVYNYLLYIIMVYVYVCIYIYIHVCVHVSIVYRTVC